MCGIFGLIRNTESDKNATLRATELLLMLGIKSEERGIDASGLALISNDKVENFTAPMQEDADSKFVSIDNTTIIKDSVPFRKLPIKENLTQIDEAFVIIGHTRAASQGKADSVTNGSPLLSGALVGTHNGDVSINSVPHYADIQKTVFGETDTEVLYGALNKARQDRRNMVKVLRTVKGRAALAFADRTNPERLYIARAALSPVSYAYTQDGDFVYASNPDWFRQIEEETLGRVSFTNITLVPEGHFLTVNTVTREIENIRFFTPICRDTDLYLINTAVYRKFKIEDKNADKLLHRHRIAAKKLTAWPALTPAPAIEKKEVAFTPLQNTLWDEKATWDENTFIEPVDEFFEDEVNQEELEALCWASGTFDSDMYAEIMDASPVEGLELFEEYKKTVAEAWVEGKTAVGFPFKQ